MVPRAPVCPDDVEEGGDHHAASPALLHAARLSILRGEWPLWNPYVAAGDILAAAAQPTPYEPISLVSLLLPMPVSLTFLAAITFFLGALLMFLFLREIACSRED